MKIEINRKVSEVPQNCNNLLELLEHEGLAGAGKAVAVDNCVVPRARWQETALTEGMKITVIQAVCGG